MFTSFFAVAWAGYGLLVEYRTGYLDKLRATPIARFSILAGEMVPLFFEAAIMAGDAARRERAPRGDAGHRARRAAC